MLWQAGGWICVDVWNEGLRACQSFMRIYAFGRGDNVWGYTALALWMIESQATCTKDKPPGTSITLYKSFSPSTNLLCNRGFNGLVFYDEEILIRFWKTMADRRWIYVESVDMKASEVAIALIWFKGKRLIVCFWKEMRNGSFGRKQLRDIIHPKTNLLTRSDWICCFREKFITVAAKGGGYLGAGYLLIWAVGMLHKCRIGGKIGFR